MRCSAAGRIADIDLATPARPEEVIAALAKAGIKVVPTGIAHGTVTAVVNAPAAAPFRDHHAAPRCRDLRAACAGRLRCRLGGRRRAPRFHDQRDLSRSRRHRARPGRRAGRSRGPPRALCRRPGDADRRGCAAGACAITASRRGSARGERRPRGARRLPRGGAAVAEAVGRAGRAGADPAAGGAATRCRRLRMMGEDGVLAAVLPEATRLDRLRAADRARAAQPDPLRRLAALVAVDARRRGGDGRAAAAVERPARPARRPGAALAARSGRRRAGRSAARCTGSAPSATATSRCCSPRRAAWTRRPARRNARLWPPAGRRRAFPLAGRDVTALGIPPGAARRRCCSPRCDAGGRRAISPPTAPPASIDCGSLPRRRAAA